MADYGTPHALSIRMTTTLRLDWQDIHGQIHTFDTLDADWQGETWNGHPAPRIPKWQDYLLGLLVGEDHGQPSLHADDEADMVHADDWTWREMSVNG